MALLMIDRGGGFGTKDGKIKAIKGPRASGGGGGGGVPTEAEAKQNFELVGEGKDGRVYRDGDIAYKYSKDLTGKRFESEDFLESMAMSEKAAELGIGPKMYGVDKLDGQILTRMEYLSGYKDGLSPYELNDPRTKPFNESLIGNIKVAYRNGYIFSDLHEENIMYSVRDQKVKHVDSPIVRGSGREKADQLFDQTSWRPLAAETISNHVNNFGTKEQKKQLKALQKKYRRSFEMDGTTTKDDRFYEDLSNELLALVP